MLNLNGRLLKLEDYRARRQPPSDPRLWRLEDYHAWHSALSPEELAQIDAQANAELAAWEWEIERDNILEDEEEMTND